MHEPGTYRAPSNASVPSAAAFSVKVPAVCDDDPRKIFGVFPAEVASKAKTHGGTMVGGQGLTIHAISEQRLGMKSISHIDALPQCAHNCPALIGIREWLEDNVSRLGTCSGKIQYRRQPHAGPFGNIGPTLLAGVQRYMAFGRQAAQIFERNTSETSKSPLDRQAQDLEAVREK